MLKCPICGAPLVYTTNTDHHCLNCNYGRNKSKSVGSIGKDKDGKEIEVIRLECKHQNGEEGYIYKVTGENKINPVVVSKEDIASGKHTEEEIKIILAEQSVEDERKN
jgi:hypothetical protein